MSALCTNSVSRHAPHMFPVVLKHWQTVGDRERLLVPTPRILMATSWKLSCLWMITFTSRAMVDIIWTDWCLSSRLCWSFGSLTTERTISDTNFFNSSGENTTEPSGSDCLGPVKFAPLPTASLFPAPGTSSLRFSGSPATTLLQSHYSASCSLR